MSAHPQKPHDAQSPLATASAFSLMLAVVKFTVYLYTDSVLLLATCLDSAGDAVISFINHRIQSVARSRPDREHPFGHGGFEVISSLVQGTILLSFGIIIALESIQRLSRLHSAQSIVENPGYGAITLGIAALSGLAIHGYLHKHERALVAAKKRSLSIRADQAHYLADFWVNMASALALTLIHFSDWQWLDPACALVGSILLGKTSIPIIRNGIKDILHVELDTDTKVDLANTVLNADPQIKGIHRLRARRYGPTLFVDFHLKLPSDLNLQEAHELGEVARAAVCKRFPHTDVVIHLDPDSEPDDDWWDDDYPHKKDP